MEEEKKIITRENLKKIEEGIFEISKDFKPEMRVPARVIATEEMLDDILQDRSLVQLTNMATLPGIQKCAYAMPDIHEGYGFPIGGVAAMSLDKGGVISPGGIGYDINCGVRLLRSNVYAKDIKNKLDLLATEISRSVPSGLGRSSQVKLSDSKLNDILKFGPQKALEMGYGEQDDIEFCESHGIIKDAGPEYISDRAKDRGRGQLNTLGSGNHFLEIQEVKKILDSKVAKAFGLEEGMVVVMIHCGSRGLGHQVCTDYVKIMVNNLDSWGISLPDQELACVPFESIEGQKYFKAMSAAANFAWTNRHIIGHFVRQNFEKILNAKIKTVYDIAHNIGKVEEHVINGQSKKVILHRKGATRAFPAGHPEIISQYIDVGHPVFVPGTMGTSSYVMVGTQKGLEETFGSCCHGAGRKMSRSKAKKTVQGRTLRDQLAKKGIIIKARSDVALAEEAPLAYKDVDTVVKAIESSGIGRRVAQLVPLAVIKGD